MTAAIPVKMPGKVVRKGLFSASVGFSVAMSGTHWQVPMQI
jgi:hypothetical protein